MNTVTIDEAREQKQNMERKIQDAVEQFYLNTSLEVVSIRLDNVKTKNGQMLSVLISTEVKLL